jgi:heme/copper-type cytochrome/quinol oxidase subunit 2
MIKPYQITGESRYLGLPIGFGILGVTYAISAFIFSQLFILGTGTVYIQLILRVFAFLFLCITYYFSRKKGENKQRIWNTTLALLVIGFIISLVLVSIPDVISTIGYQNLSFFVRVFNLFLIGYIFAHTLRSHIEKPDPETIWIPLGFILFGLSQGLLIIFAIDSGNSASSMAAWWGALAIRWAAIGVFLFITCRSFYCVKKGDDK